MQNNGHIRDVICYVKPGENKNENWIIALSRQLLKPIVKWFYLVAGHPEEKRLKQTIKARYHHLNLRTEIPKFKCAACQKFKLPSKRYRLLPERELKEQPFQESDIDLIGPWPFKILDKEHTFLALTIIDPVTNFTELARIDNKQSEHAARKFAQAWLSRYLWSERCIHDNSGKFTEYKFKKLVEQSNMKGVPKKIVTQRLMQSANVCIRLLGI